MKFKRMMAVLLAASMVVSSTGVGVLADEFTFDDGIVVDEVVVEDAGFEVEEPVVEDEIFVEEPVVEEVGFVEEPVVDENADIYAAIASEETEYANDNGTIQFPDVIAKDVQKPYDGTKLPLDITLTGGGTGWILQYQKKESMAFDGTKWTETEPEIINGIQSGVYGVRVTKDLTNFSTPVEFTATITPAKVTISLNDPKFKYADDLDKALKTTDLNVVGMSADQVAKELTIDTENAAHWYNMPLEDNNVRLGDATLKKADKAGTFSVPGTKLASFNIIHVDNTKQNYEITFADSTVTVAKYDLAVTWPTKTALEFTGTKQAYVGNGDSDPKMTITPAKDPLDGTTTLVLGFTGNEGTKVDSYTAKITGVYRTAVDTANDVTKNFNIAESSMSKDWSIGKQKLYAVVDPALSGTRHLVYGQESATKGLTKANIIYYELKNGAYVQKDVAQSDINGTNVVFGTDFTPYTAARKTVKIWYESGLTSEKYDIVSHKENTLSLTVEPAPVVVTANKITVNVNDPQPNLDKEYTVEDWRLTYNDATTLIEGTAKTFKRDVDNGSIEVTLATVPVNPSEVGTYPIVVTMADSGKQSALANYKVYETKESATAKNPEGTEKKVEMTYASKYNIIWGDFKVKFEDFKGAYDGQPHTITVTPDPLPKGVEVYYQMVKGNVTTPPANYKPESTDPQYADKVAAFKAASSKNLPTITNLADSVATVYYYVESKDANYTDWGKSTITLLDEEEAKAAEVEKKIEEATKRDAEGNLDPDKVKEAEDAYNALSDKEKKEVSPAAKKKLEDAVAEVKDQIDKKAAKAVEDAIDKLPEADKATAADKEAADAAVEAYGKLTDDQKKLVPADKVKKMNDVKAAADKAAEDADAKAAKDVADAIEALPTPSDVTLADKEKIEAADKALEGLTDAQKALVPVEDKEKLLAAKQALAAAEEAEKKAEEEAKVAKDAIAAIKTADPGKGKEATEAARKAYDGLSMSARAKMTEDEVKELAQAETCYGKDATFTAGEGIYRVLSNGDVTYLKPTHPENTYFQVPNDVKCPEGYSFKVVKVSTQAFKGCSNVKKIWMGKNIVTIGAYAFKGATNLTKLIVRTQDITVPSKVTNAFKAGGKSKGAKLNVQVWEKMISTYEPMFRNEGGLNAKAKITALD